MAVLQGLEAEFRNVEGPQRKRWAGEWGRLWALGPKHYGACVLLNHCDRFLTQLAWVPYAARLLRTAATPTPRVQCQ